mgnify:CR=1 FL=1
MARYPHNIEPSAFRKGECVGYGNGLVWRMTYNRPFWRMWSNKGDYTITRSLAQASLNIEKWVSNNS